MSTEMESMIRKILEDMQKERQHQLQLAQRTHLPVNVWLP